MCYLCVGTSTAMASANNHRPSSLYSVAGIGARTVGGWLCYSKKTPGLQDDTYTGVAVHEETTHLIITGNQS